MRNHQRKKKRKRVTKISPMRLALLPPQTGAEPPRPPGSAATSLWPRVDLKPFFLLSGLITPGGFSSVPAGMETPELIELRKKKIEEAMDG